MYKSTMQLIYLETFVIWVVKSFNRKNDTFLWSFNAFGIIKHLFDRASSNIRFVVQVVTDGGLSFASSNMSLFLHNKSNVRLDYVWQVYNE